jgi:hypothetical protein
MSSVTRLCSRCSYGNPLETQFCGRCGADMHASHLPAARETHLPALVRNAAMPVLAGITTLAVSAGIRLVQGILRQALASATKAAASSTALQRNAAADIVPAERRNRTIRIRSSWAVTDGQGNFRQGQSEHVIDLDE